MVPKLLYDKQRGRKLLRYGENVVMAEDASFIALSLDPDAEMKQENEEFVTDSPGPEGPLAARMTGLLNSKKYEWETVRKRTGPLRLLDLPVDILRLIVKEVVYTNNLNSLAMTHSTLYSLAVPLLYARFDIVWPELDYTSQDSKGVDALTYGLSTLCLGSKFAQMTRWLRENTGDQPLKLADNQYARYTRKFSIGNGLPNLISEYMITKENGKMLGTLVALAVAKMINLETFVWDMPTGVLSDIFMALASLRTPDGMSKLEKVWIRWHDNSDAANNSTTSSSTDAQAQPTLAIPPPINPSTSAQPNNTSMRMQPVKYSESSVEYPTFSVLPALESLTVLDVDEISYLDEISILVERSKSRLEELQIGISEKAYLEEFALIHDSDPSLQQVDLDARWPGESRIGDRRLGGVLGVVFGRVYDIRRKTTSKSKEKESSHTSLGSNGVTSSSATRGSSKTLPGGRRRLDGKLRLKTLGLERVAIHSHVCTRAIDWTILTSLTILDCTYNESLWKALKRQFQPLRLAPVSSSSTQKQYHLALKYIHTNHTSESLISFIKETLAPNTLEVLFLQDRRRSPTTGVPPPVPVGRIFRGAIKRHRRSLRKLLLDSSARRPRGADARRWTHWMLTSEIVSYITSGRMGNLRELAASFDHKDWHHFLQRLFNVPQLRSLHVSNMNGPQGGDLAPREIALQIVDIVTLRPEIQLCYVGVKNKCFEIMEARSSHTSSSSSNSWSTGPVHGSSEPVVIAMDDDDHFSETEGDEDTEDDGDDGDNNDNNANMNDDDDDFTEVSDDADSEVGFGSEGDEEEYFKSRFRLREILFYDDKIAIFKARHGKL